MAAVTAETNATHNPHRRSRVQAAYRLGDAGIVPTRAEHAGFALIGFGECRAAVARAVARPR